MRLGEMLVARGLVTAADIEFALQRQQAYGGRLRDNLVALDLLSEEQLSAAIEGTPPVPSSLEETGIHETMLLGLVLKLMLRERAETAVQIANHLKLHRRLVDQLVSELVKQRLVQALGSGSAGVGLLLRYGLSEQGRAAAREAEEENEYVGPAPVTLQAFQHQIEQQRISNEALDVDALRQGFGGLVISEEYIRRLLPAVRSGRSILLFGPPGNGKTTLATRIGQMFKDVVYIPYAVEVGGKIMKVFDQSLHQPVVTETINTELGSSLYVETFDQRWVPCRRPVVVAGGEFTLDMLDLPRGPNNGVYDAPLHVKAFNGMFLIDDFGRQQFRPDELLNRWIVPMESRVDYLKLSTGASFSLPFDVLLVFSTNLKPADLIDPAFLRRIQYKLKLDAPEPEEYRQIFASAAASRSLAFSEEVIDYVIEQLAPFGLAYYQPKFICDQVKESCKCLNLPPRMTPELAADALRNLYFDIADGTVPVTERRVADLCPLADDSDLIEPSPAPIGALA
ncbi:MAG TPA: hypothetical protein VNV38_10565 [Stellaceae bacterium]|jgi:hypothetical protein|nr:hypothetical protein [Stellaceae bacterium]